MATLRINKSFDYRDTALSNISDIVFATRGLSARAIFDGDQFDVGQISSSVHIVGDGKRNFIEVHLAPNPIGFIALGWTFENWTDPTASSVDEVDIFGSTSADTIVGSVRSDSILGDIGNDKLSGFGGNDQLIGGAGHDTLFGGKGDDFYRLDTITQFGDRLLRRSRYDDVREDADSGIDTVVVTPLTRSLSSYTLTVNVENGVIVGGGTFGLTGNASNNQLTGNNFNNRLSGLDGKDILRGEQASDTLDGGTASDTLFGGTDDDLLIYAQDGTSADNIDTFNGDDGDDTFFVSSETIADKIVDLQFGTFGGVEAVRGILNSIENVTVAAGHTVIGNDGVNVIVGTSATKANAFSGRGDDDTLDGGGGNDTLDGGVGADSMTGGLGNDQFFVDNAGDIVVELDGEGVDTVNSTITFTLFGKPLERLKLEGTATIDGFGNDLANTLTGNGATNLLNGLLGNDTLAGGLNGDRFVFTQPLGPGNVDTIVDFFAPDDSIRLSVEIVDDLDVGLLAASAFKNITTGTKDADDRILYRQTDGGLFYDRDGSGNTFAAVQFAVLENRADIFAGDFLVIPTG